MLNYQLLETLITKILFQVDATKVFAMNWRFFPTLDPQVCNFQILFMNMRARNMCEIFFLVPSKKPLTNV